MKNSKTAILIFAHSTSFEATQKPFSNAEAVFDLLNKQTLKQVQKTNLPYFLVTEKEQIGDSFGQRFTNAIKSVYDLGYANVIVIGNDSPHLSHKHLARAIQSLNQNKAIIGHSKDGGFYLLGLSKNDFNTTDFLKLPWQKKHLSTAVHRFFKQKNKSLACLEKLSDLDSAEDISNILNCFKLVSRGLFQLFLKIYYKAKLALHYTLAFSSSKIILSTYNKGSPYILYN